MRFDYIPPYTYYRLFNIRKYFTMFWAGAGLVCVCTALFAHKPFDISNTDAPQQTISLKPKLTTTVLKQLQDLSFKAGTTNVAKQVAKKHTLALAPIKPKWHTVEVNTGDTLSKIFNNLALPNNTLNEVLTVKAETKQLTKLAPGQKLKFLVTPDSTLQALQFPLSATKTLNIKLTANGYKASYENRPITKKVSYFATDIKDSLFLSGQAVGLPDKTIMELADIFGCDIDFALDIRKQDSFKILFEEDYVDGKKVNTGNILMAEFTNKNKIYKAIRYTDPDGHTGYYSPEGYRMQKAFLRTPVKFTRISSKFSTARRHPILHKIRAHHGVDYAAPSGTPVKAAGDGKIVFVGRKNGYGNTIEVLHGRKYSTLYAHLSKFSDKAKRHGIVKQGEVIGYVGRTGLASGDHLHYEFRVNGIHRDPLSVTLPKSLPIAQQHKNAFLRHAKQMLSMLVNHEVDKS